MRAQITIAVVLLGLSVSGCATIMEGTTQTVGLTTPPTTGAICVLKNERGSWTVTTPGLVEVKRSTTDLLVTCKKDGWADATATLHSKTSDGMTFTALLWGPVGIGVDAASGATFHYPSGLELPMTPVAAPPAAPPPAAQPTAAQPTAAPPPAAQPTAAPLAPTAAPPVTPAAVADPAKPAR